MAMKQTATVSVITMPTYSAVIRLNLWILNGAVPLTAHLSTHGCQAGSLCVSSYHAYIFCSYMDIYLDTQWSSPINSSSEYPWV